MADASDIALEVFYDYQCPFVNAAVVWVREVEQQLGRPLNLTWRAFPLEQVNSDKGPDWKLWEQADSYRSRGLPAFRAALAAQAQGDDAFRRFHWALIQARHVDGKDLGKPDTLRGAAETAGLDIDRFEADRVDRSLLPRIGEDWAAGRDRLGVFGTPTFVFPNGEAIYLKFKLGAVPQGEEAATFFEEFVRLGQDRPNVLELKRPTPPS